MNALQQISWETVLIPAYGRKYRTDEEMLKDWKDGKDFKCFPNGPYGSIRDIKYLKDTSSRVLITKDHFNYTRV